MDKDVIRCVTFNSDATKLFCGCEDGRVLLLSVEGDLCNAESILGKELWRCDDKVMHSCEISAVYCVDDKSFFSGDENGVVKVGIVSFRHA